MNAPSAISNVAGTREFSSPRNSARIAPGSEAKKFGMIASTPSRAGSTRRLGMYTYAE